jgi:hypothetical protein
MFRPHSLGRRRPALGLTPSEDEQLRVDLTVMPNELTSEQLQRSGSHTQYAIPVRAATDIDHLCNPGTAEVSSSF